MDFRRVFLHSFFLLMATDMTAPATKQDLQDFMKHIDGTIADLYRANEQWKDEIKGELMEYMDSKEKDLRLHFDFTVENIRHDLRGAHHDDIDNLKIRVTRLERHTKLRGA